MPNPRCERAARRVVQPVSFADCEARRSPPSPWRGRPTPPARPGRSTGHPTTPSDPGTTPSPRPAAGRHRLHPPGQPLRGRPVGPAGGGRTARSVSSPGDPVDAPCPGRHRSPDHSLPAFVDSATERQSRKDRSRPCPPQDHPVSSAISTAAPSHLRQAARPATRQQTGRLPRHGPATDADTAGQGEAAGGGVAGRVVHTELDCGVGHVVGTALRGAELGMVEHEHPEREDLGMAGGRACRILQRPYLDDLRRRQHGAMCALLLDPAECR